MIKHILRASLVITGLIALVTGGWALVTGTGASTYEAIDRASNHILDSNLRYYAAMWIAAGLAMLWLARVPERHVALLRTLAVMVFLGGVGRIVSMVELGMPPMPFPLFTVFELAFLVVVPLQNKLRSPQGATD